MGFLTRFRWLIDSKEGLYQRVVQAGFWAGLLRGFTRFLGLSRYLVLAHFLQPKDFGQFGIAMLSFMALQQLSKMGFNEAIISRKDPNVDSHLNTAWTVKLIRGFTVGALFFLIAPLVAQFFSTPKATNLLRGISLLYVLRAAVNPAVLYFQKNLEFQKQFLYVASGQLVNFIVALITAMTLQSAWAFVLGLLAGDTVRLIVSHTTLDYSPRPEFDWDIFWELFQYGKWIFGSVIISFLATQGDDVFVGWFLPAAALGFYQMAFKFGNTPATEVAQVISQVMFPAYSKIRASKEQLTTAYRITLDVIALVSTPMSVGLVLVGPSFVRLGFGETWTSIITPLQIIAVGGLVRATVASGGALFRGADIPEWEFKTHLIRVVVIGLTIYPLTNQYGITGSAVSITLGISSTVPIWYYISTKVTSLRITEYFQTFAIPLVASFVMAIPVHMIIQPTVLWLSISILIGAFVYLTTVHILYELTGRHPVKQGFQRISNPSTN